METLKSALVKFFGVVVRGQTYLNALYLLLAFPLGIFYFVFLVTGLSLGFATIIIWIGLLVLAFVFAAWYVFVVFERQMAVSMLREDIPPVWRQDLSGKTLWQKFTATLTNPVTWKGLVYLFAKFPLGILSFVVLVTLVSVSVAFIGLPFYYPQVHSDVVMTLNGIDYFNPFLIFGTLPGALVGSLLGILMALVSLHVFNGLAWVSGKFARVMLGNFGLAPVAPAAIMPQPVEPAPAIVEDAPALEVSAATSTGSEALDHSI